MTMVQDVADKIAIASGIFDPVIYAGFFALGSIGAIVFVLYARWTFHLWRTSKKGDLTWLVLGITIMFGAMVAEQVYYGVGVLAGPSEFAKFAVNTVWVSIWKACYTVGAALHLYGYWSASDRHKGWLLAGAGAILSVYIVLIYQGV